MIAKSEDTISFIKDFDKMTSSVTKAPRWLSEKRAKELSRIKQLGWPTVKAVLATRPGVPEGAEPQTEFNKYLKLSAENAQRVLRFLKARKVMSNTDLNKLLAEA